MVLQRCRWLVPLALLGGVLSAADKETTTIQAYVDSDICSHLYTGSLTPARMECTKDTYKQGSNPVLVRLTDKWVFEVNKEKMIKKLVGELATAEGQVNYGDSTMKLASVQPLDRASIPAGKATPALLESRPAKANAALHERVRHELAMMPYVGYFDFISFTLDDGQVTLTGWTTRPTNRSEAQNRVKQIEGVETVVNNMEVTPLSPMDNQIRAAALGALQRNLSRYFWGSGSDIKIVVKRGDIILLGTVATKTDSDIAALRCNGVPSAFHVFNLLKVAEGGDAAKKEKGK